MGSRIKNSRNYIQIYLAEIGRFSPLSMEAEADLFKKIKKGDMVAFEELVKCNLRFVVSVAKGYQGKGLLLTDLIGEGNLGLIKAVGRFDETRGFKFITYAVWWIRQSILQAMAEQQRMVYLPLNRIKVINKVGRALEFLEKKHGRKVSVLEVAHKAKVGVSDVYRAFAEAPRHLSFDSLLDEGKGSKYCLLDIVSNDSHGAPDKWLMQDSLREEVERVLLALEPREREVIRSYFGFGEGEEGRRLTLQEIGRNLGLTRERVRQIKERGLRRLRQYSKREKLKKYLG